MFARNRIAKALFTGLLSGASATAFAGNGIYLIGYGTESALMGGADVAVARDAFATNNNSADMSRLRGQAADKDILAAPVELEGFAQGKGERD